MNDTVRRQLLREDRRAFEFMMGRDTEHKPTRESVKAERAAIESLRQRVLRAADMPRGNERDLEMRRIYRALTERGIELATHEYFTREQSIVRWAFNGTRLKAPKQPKCKPVATRDDGTRVLTVYKK